MEKNGGKGDRAERNVADIGKQKIDADDRSNKN